MTLSLLLGLAALQGTQAPNPRAPYWQQRADYEITASLDEARGVLGGSERIHYRNNSPDTLHSFSLHL